jgi:hypothetical protein
MKDSVLTFHAPDAPKRTLDQQIISDAKTQGRRDVTLHTFIGIHTRPT